MWEVALSLEIPCYIRYPTWKHKLWDVCSGWLRRTRAVCPWLIWIRFVPAGAQHTEVPVQCCPVCTWCTFWVSPRPPAPPSPPPPCCRAAVGLRALQALGEQCCWNLLFSSLCILRISQRGSRAGSVLSPGFTGQWGAPEERVEFKGLQLNVCTGPWWLWRLGFTAGQHQSDLEAAVWRTWSADLLGAARSGL